MRDSVSEGPVFFHDLDEIDDDIFVPDAGIMREHFGDAGVKRLLLIERAGVIGGDLNQNEIASTRNIEIG